MVSLPVAHNIHHAFVDVLGILRKLETLDGKILPCWNFVEIPEVRVTVAGINLHEDRTEFGQKKQGTTLAADILQPIVSVVTAAIVADRAKSVWHFSPHMTYWKCQLFCIFLV